METKIIIAAIIRLWSLSHFISALFVFMAVPTHLQMISSSMSSAVQQSGRNVLITDAFNFSRSTLLGLVLWFCAYRIATLVLKTIENRKS